MFRSFGTRVAGALIGSAMVLLTAVQADAGPRRKVVRHGGNGAAVAALAFGAIALGVGAAIASNQRRERVYAPPYPAYSGYGYGYGGYAAPVYSEPVYAEPHYVAQPVYAQPVYRQPVYAPQPRYVAPVYAPTVKRVVASPYGGPRWAYEAPARAGFRHHRQDGNHWQRQARQRGMGF